MFGVYLIGFTQNAETGGMQKELHLSSSDYSLILSIFFIVSTRGGATRETDCSQGYLLNEVPCNMILARSRPSLFLPAIMFIWVRFQDLTPSDR